MGLDPHPPARTPRGPGNGARRGRARRRRRPARAVGTSRRLAALAALAAGNFAAVSTMAKIIGEHEFSLLFHKGENESIHFTKVTNDFLLITIFSNKISLGFLRLKVTEAGEKIKKILGHPQESQDDFFL